MLELVAQDVAVVRVAGEAARTDHQALLVRDDQADLHAELVGVTGLALGDALHLRRVQRKRPEVANRLKVDFPDDKSMRISHEAIYQAVYIEGQGALKRELVGCLCRGRALRVSRARARAEAWAHVCVFQPIADGISV